MYSARPNCVLWNVRRGAVRLVVAVPVAIIVAVTFIALAPQAAHAQAERPVITEAEVVVTGNTLRKVYDTINADAQALRNPTNDPDIKLVQCSFYAQAVTLIEAYQVLAFRYANLEHLATIRDQMVSFTNHYCTANNQRLGESVTYPGDKLANGGGGSTSRVMPELALAFLYMTKVQRMAYLAEVTPETGLALTSWLDENFETAQIIAEGLTGELSLPLELPGRFELPTLPPLEVIELPPPARFDPSFFLSPPAIPEVELPIDSTIDSYLDPTLDSSSIFIIGQVLDVPTVDSLTVPYR